MMIRRGYSFTQPELLSKLGTKLPEPLSVLEIPGDLLDSSVHLPKFKALRRQGVELCARDLIAPEIAGLIPEENCKLRAELEQHFNSRCARAAEAGITELTNTFDLTGALENPKSKLLLALFLKRCAGIAYRFHQNLRLLLRVPGGSGVPAPQILYAFRRELLLPNITWCMELHPHEPGMQEQLDAILPLFRACDHFRRICYNAESGNILTPGALKCCCRTLSDTAEELTLLLDSGNVPLDEATLATLNAYQG